MMMEIFGVKLVILKSVYPPSDDSYLLVREMVINKGDVVLEVCAGTGIASVVAASRGAREVVSIDVNPEAALNIAINAVLNGYEDRIHPICADLTSPLRPNFTYDVILINPPYLPVEDKVDEALWWSAGVDGRKIIDRFLSNVKDYVKENSRVYLVQSSLSNVEKTISYFSKMGFETRIKGLVHKFFEDIVVVEAVYSG